MTTPHSDASPTPLRVAAVLAAVQAVAVLGLAVLELTSLTTARLTMGTTTAAFFAVYGLALLACARGLLGARPWARSPLVLAQLIWLGIAWSFRGGGTTWFAALLAGAAVAALVALLHPASTAVLERED